MQLPTPIDLYESMLNLLSESMDDYYYLYEFRSDLVYFSDNIRRLYDIFSGEKTVCTLEKWRSIVDIRDVGHLKEAFQMLSDGRMQAYNIDYRVTTRYDRMIWINSCGKCYCGTDGKPLYVLGRLSDKSPANKTDSLTGALGMAALKKEVSELLEAGKDGFFLLIGIDNLKAINLKQGRQAGDNVLKKLLEVIEKETNWRQQVFQINGDCFAINLLEEKADKVTCFFLKIRENMRTWCTISGGCVSYTEYQMPDAETVLQYAEVSLDYAKAHGKDMLKFFSVEDYEKKIAALDLREDLEKSVKDNFSGFSLEYQPQVRSESYELYGAEALLRYSSPRCGNVPPTEFVPILEQSNLMYEVGLWVLENALQQCSKWRRYIPDFHISINMSYTQFSWKRITDDVLKTLKNSGLPGDVVTIEITESLQMQNYPQLNDVFLKWKKAGIQISVDDFGTGYSSLGCLKELKIDEIKIDRCFVNQIQNSAYNYRLLSNMMELADSCQIRVCCEGVETIGELATLEDLHPDLLQGFLFSKPCPPDIFEKRYIEHNSEEFQSRILREQQYRQYVHDVHFRSASMEIDNEITKAILEAEEDVFCLSDLETYELYYLNTAGQKMFGMQDYQGRKCYKVLHGYDAPCPFCPNSCLRQDSFHVWEYYNEYCGRHLLLKAKTISYMGKNVRLEIAFDITKQELVSQATQERLKFAEKIVGYMNTLADHADYREAIHQVLASVGEFYQADRAYLFEPSEEYWNNTSEWCAPNISRQRENLQMVSPEVVSRWTKLFENNESIIILNVNSLRSSSPLEWSVLEKQGIQRLIVVPVRDHNKTIGFIGVDNPRYAIQDDSQIRVLTSFLVTRIRQDQNENRYQALLESSNQDIMDSLGVGFWIIEIRAEGLERTMIFDDTMCRIMGLSERLSPEKCYRFWFSRTQPEYLQPLEETINRMMQTNEVVQLEYTWILSENTPLKVRFSGIRWQSEENCVRLKGYFRII